MVCVHVLPPVSNGRAGRRAVQGAQWRETGDGDHPSPPRGDHHETYAARDATLAVRTPDGFGLAPEPRWNSPDVPSCETLHDVIL